MSTTSQLPSRRQAPPQPASFGRRAVPRLLLAAIPLLASCLAAASAESAAVLPDTRGAGGIDPAVRVEVLDPGRWHEPVRARSPRMAGLNANLREALLASDADRVAAAVAALRAELGPEASLPEAKTDYVAAPGDAVPDLAGITQLWLEDCRRREGREPWDAAAQALASGRTPGRLRDCQRMASAYLATARLLGPGAGKAFRERALAGLRFVRSCQTRAGVFGYPYDPRRTDRLGQRAAALVERGRKLGRIMVEGPWIVDDLGEGDLQFDNGVCGLAMLEAHALTGERAFLESAVRAADWALARPLVPNWNYNAFSARLLARAYLATREPRFLDAARRTFALGVLPGQTETGRWFDPHNARTQYHAILATALSDHVELLAAVGAPERETAARALSLALDSLAAQALAFGPSNPHELLALEALQRGTEVLSPKAVWDRAAGLFLSVLATDLRERIVAGAGHLPETTPFGLLQLGRAGVQPAAAAVPSAPPRPSFP